MNIINKLYTTTFGELHPGKVFIDMEGTVCMKLFVDATYINNAVVLKNGETFLMDDNDNVQVPKKVTLILE